MPFEFLESMTEPQRQALYLQARTMVEPYCPKIDLVPSFNMRESSPKFQLIISAQADAEYFGKARELAALAPDTIPNWTFRALMPPMPRELEMRYQFNGELLYPADLWCQLLENPDDPSFLGIRVSLRYYDRCPENKLEELQQLVIVMVGNVLGEEAWGRNVHYLDLAPLPLDPLSEEGMFNLFDIGQRIEEFREDRKG